MQIDLLPAPPSQDFPPGILLKTGFLSLERQSALLAAVAEVAALAPLARPRTPRGGQTSAAMTNCGRVGWWSDSGGYRYQANCPGTGRPWPMMPPEFCAAAAAAVAESPWPAFAPDACLINFYRPDAKMGLHQDKDERDFSQPIVTVCLGDDADFLIGGFKRSDPTRVIVVRSGDVLIFGGDSRLRYHGIRKIYPNTGPFPDVGGRTSLTFRKAL